MLGRLLERMRRAAPRVYVRSGTVYVAWRGRELWFRLPGRDSARIAAEAALAAALLLLLCAALFLAAGRRFGL